MSLLFYYFFIAIGLSMDSFSLAIIYGTTGIKKKVIILLSLIVGIFHFIMPNIGGYLTTALSIKFQNYTNIISGVIFLILAVEMITSFKDKETKYNLDKLSSLLLFALAVSLDSFSIGIALTLDGENVTLAGLVFLMVSAIFTFLGLILGKFLSNKTGNISKVIGIIILLILAIKYFIE